ncbi:hypothetical protein OIU79_012805 [Salix purpurea]|uniref:Secreted protein n=1 Tax=Salix purpurea TaxID=77065 RepID=A0A9Q0Q3Z8_SALPP|nr:hypothetical protein OIU79_012805 [Salix purpurea]
MIKGQHALILFRFTHLITNLLFKSSLYEKTIFSKRSCRLLAINKNSSDITCKDKCLWKNNPKSSINLMKCQAANQLSVALASRA